MRIAAGIFYYRYWPQIRETVDGLLAQTRHVDEIVALDNGSGDNAAAHLRESYPSIEVHQIRVNEGPVVGYNQLISTLLSFDCDAILTLAHDCRLAPTALEHLAARLEADDAVGAVGPLLGVVSEPERVCSAGGMVDPRTWHPSVVNVPEQMSAWSTRGPVAVHWLNGSAVLQRAAAARDTGPLNEKFFYSYDEVDYFTRMRRRGWRVECVPEALAWEDPGPGSPYLEVRNQLGLIARNAPKRILVRETLRTLYWAFQDVLRGPRGTDRRRTWLQLRGLVDFLRNRWGPPPSLRG
jgi:GT2 family glycosyltransferase